MHSRFSELKQNPVYPLPRQETGVVKPMPARMPVRFEDVRFGYEALGRDVLKGIGFTIPAGQMVALVGQAGAGKSTCARLLQRLWMAEVGTVRIGAMDVKALSMAVLRDLVAVVPQECSLHPDSSVREALRLGKPDATPAEVETAARQTQVHEVILRLPQGYGTAYETWREHLTAGERQRIAMARALLGKAPVVILHETASRLNTADEKALQQTLLHLRHHRTVLLISHRLSTIRMADNIIVLEDGVIVEEGRHDHLVAWNDRYAHLIATGALRN